MENISLSLSKGIKANSIIAHGDEQFKPNTTVAAIIHHQGKFLLVEEVDQGNTVYNQPAGHLEKGEDLIGAIKREVLEETGLTLSPDYLSGIYYLYRKDVDLYFIRFCFVIELTEYFIGKPQDDEITATHWLSLTDIKNKTSELRSTMVLECIEDYLVGNKITLSCLKSML
jgi:phosphatase NudJ